MEHFTINELSKSDIAKKNGIDNTPDEASKRNLELLVDNILDPLRRKWEKPIVVNCGYRCEELNKLVKGSKTSQHRFGQAADIEDASRDEAENKRLFDLIREMRLPFDQLINEFGYSWIHISYSRTLRRGQVLEAKTVGGKTQYTAMK